MGRCVAAEQGLDMREGAGERVDAVDLVVVLCRCIGACGGEAEVEIAGGPQPDVGVDPFAEDRDADGAVRVRRLFDLNAGARRPGRGGVGGPAVSYGEVRRVGHSTMTRSETRRGGRGVDCARVGRGATFPASLGAGGSAVSGERDACSGEGSRRIQACQRSAE